MEFEKVLLPYQKRFAKNALEKKFSIWNASRQIGKSFVVAFLALLKALSTPRSLVVVVSASERQAVELLGKVKLHVEFLTRIGEQVNVSFFEDVKTNVHRVELPNGSRILSVPANPDTVRGFSATLVILDEFAFVQQDEELWKAVFPMITRRKEARLVITSTPKGKSNMFYKLFVEAEKDPLWYTQKTTIYDAVKEGLDVDVEALRRGIKNEDAWRQEYLCEFLDEAGAFLTYELIQSCEQPPEKILVSDLTKLSGNLFMGVDVGRRKDLTVVTVIEKQADILITRRIEVLQKLPFSQQFNLIDHLAHFVRKVAIDETGIGMQLAEELKKKWGELKVLPVYFTAKTKEELASRLKAVFEDRNIRIPADPELREDLHSVEKVVTEAGNVKLSANRSEHGHADRFWSLALAVYAASQTQEKVYAPPVFVSSKPKKENSRWEFLKALRNYLGR
ncbi:MAG: terminase large subunit [Desulfurobacteriaceae bacterium]